MLTVANDLSWFRLGAGEPFLLDLQLLDASGAVIDPSTRAFVVTFYKADRSSVGKIDGEDLVDMSGPFIRFASDGTLSDGLFGKPNLLVEVAERYRNGRGVLGLGMLIIDPTASDVASFDNGVEGEFALRFTRRDPVAPGALPALSQRLIALDVATPPVASADFSDPRNSMYAGAL